MSSIYWVTSFHTTSSHSSVDLSPPTIMWARVRIPCTASTLFQFLFEVWCEKDENKQKQAEIGRYFLNFISNLLLVAQTSSQTKNSYKQKTKIRLTLTQGSVVLLNEKNFMMIMISGGFIMFIMLTKFHDPDIIAITCFSPTTVRPNDPMRSIAESVQEKIVSGRQKKFDVRSVIFQMFKLPFRMGRGE